MLLPFPGRLKPQISLGMWLFQSFCAHWSYLSLSVSLPAEDRVTVMVSVLLWVRLDTLDKSGRMYSLIRQLLLSRIQKIRLLMFPFLLTLELNLTTLSTVQPSVQAWSHSGSPAESSVLPLLVQSSRSLFQAKSLGCPLSAAPRYSSHELTHLTWPQPHWSSLGKLK